MVEFARVKVLILSSFTSWGEQIFPQGFYSGDFANSIPEVFKTERVGIGVIPYPGDQADVAGFGHQRKSTLPLSRSGAASRVTQRSATARSRSRIVRKCLSASGSSSPGQRHSAGCSSGL